MQFPSDPTPKRTPTDLETQPRSKPGNPPRFSTFQSEFASTEIRAALQHCRRLTRLTNAFSKKFENFEAAVALNFAYYNFCKTHGSLRMTPAQAAGIEASAWSVAELVKRCGE